MSIATELALLANTKESLRVAIGLSKDVPFSQYASHITPHEESGAVFDFVGNQYSKDQLPVNLSDISEFIRLSSATMWKDEQLIEVANDVPRISGEGLLIEEQRTNLATWSDDALQWGATRGVSFSATAGDGVYSGIVTQVMEDTSDDMHMWYMASPSSSIGDRHTFSLFIKPASGRSLSITSNFFTAGHIVFDFDFSTLTTAITPSNADASSEVISLGHGFYRVIFSGVSKTARPSNKAYHNLRLTSNSNISYVGSGDVGASVFGYQVEQDSTSTSYMPTSGTPVTRSPDILNIPLLPTQTIAGDWDDGVTYTAADGIATFTGHGYIRNITVEAL